MKKYNPYSVIHTLASMVVGLLSPIINLYEKKQVDKLSKKHTKYAPVFIIGAPRTGSTILYQILTNSIEILYINNLVSLLNKNFLAAFKLNKLIYSNKPHNCFKSLHGNTVKYGLNAPSECGNFWRSRIKSKKTYLGKNDCIKTIVNKLKRDINSTINYFNRPILFKNLNTSLRLKLVFEFAPNAKFIYVKRDYVETALSIIQVRKDLYGDPKVWWSIKPKEYEQIKDLPYQEQVLYQIYYIEKQIMEDAKLFADNQFLTVDYSEIKDWQSVLDKCGAFIGNKQAFRSDAKAPTKPKGKREKDQVLITQLEDIYAKIPKL